MSETNAKLKIALVWYWDRASEILPNWRDGLRAALEELERQGHEIVWFLDKKIPDINSRWDAILFWDDSNSGFFEHVDSYDCGKGIFLTTDPQNFDNLRKLDVVFCESEPIYDSVRAQGIHAVRAFGTDTDFYTWSERKKTIPYFYPATFSLWKKQSSIAHLGKELTCIGTVQPDGVSELAECLKMGVKVEEGYFPAEKIKSYYQRAEKVIIPAIHGSERTCLEAMACGIRPEVNRENVRTYSYIKELDASGLTPREFVVKNYSAKQYASAILKGICGA